MATPENPGAGGSPDANTPAGAAARTEAAGPRGGVEGGPFAGEEEDLRPRAERPPIAAVDNAALTEDAMMSFVVAAVDSDGLVGHNIKAFNDLMNEGIPQILTELFHINHIVKDFRDQTEMDRLRESVRIEFSFSDVRTGRPVYATYPIGKIKPLYPNESRLSGRTYAAPLSLAAEVALTAYYRDGREETKRAEIPPFQVAPIPVMVGSDRCHTWNLTREARKGLEEDPNESGGYFLAKGGEWVVDWLENIAFNALHVYRKMQPNEHVRGDFISQPGGAFENSSQIIIRYMVSGALTVEINSTKFSKSRIPFYFVFRILGMTSDGDILESIVFDPASPSPVARRMIQVVDRALQHEDPAYASVHSELDREKLTEFMAARLSKFVTNPTAYKSNEHAIQYLNDNLLEILDRILLPHMGVGAAARGRKLRYLGMLIHKTLLVDMGILEPTDRDSLQNKRVHGAGVSIAKAFKTQFNNSVVTPVIRALKREVRNTPFEELSVASIVDAFKNPIASSDLSRTMEQAITSGNKTIVVRRRAITNRVSTQALERKNSTNYYSALRTVSTHNASQASKQTERADMMRRVHPTYTGFICVAKSADTGEMVGMKKELAITASVCSAGEAHPLKLRLLADPAVIPLDRVAPPDIVRRGLAMVFVDGEWLGCCEEAHALVARYRALRRESRMVDPRTSIAWNPVTDDVEFLLDVGRMVRPLLIVDDNLEEYDAACRAAFAAKKAGDEDWARLKVPYVQNTRYTPEHSAGILGGRLTLEDLRAEGVLEWITPNEAANCLVAPSLGALRAAAHDVTARYTHLDVEQAVFGLTALLSPFGDHTQPARVTYQTNQGRQAGGWYCGAYPFRADKNRFFQHYCEAPLVRTIAYNWLVPNGINTVVAYMINRGYNQEDSAIVSAAFAQRGGFGGAFYRFEKAELEKGESFGNPDITTTKNLKPNASYEKLTDGFVTAGTVVVKGDVIIGRYARIQAGGRRGARTAEARDDGYKYVDRSIVYHLAEPATVVDVFRPRGPNDNQFGLVKLRYERPLGVGDKLSSRAGNKCLTPDHEVLTGTRGWVPIADVGLQDRVACLVEGRLEYHTPEAIHTYDYDDLMYECTSQMVDLKTTPNHRMWVKPRNHASYDFYEAQDIKGRRVQYQRDAESVQGDIAEHVCYGDVTGTPDLVFCMDAWLRLLGMFISDGYTVPTGRAVCLSCVKPRKIDYHFQTAALLGVPGEYSPASRAFRLKVSQIHDELAPLSVGALNKRLPDYVWALSARQARVLIAALVEGDGHRGKTSTVYCTSSALLADDVQRLALHAGWSANIVVAHAAGFTTTIEDREVVCNADALQVKIITVRNRPMMNHPSIKHQNGQTEAWVKYKGPVHCLTVPGGLFYVRRNRKPVWTGNSIAALMLPPADMPFTEEGLTPDLIINPHCLAGETRVTLANGLSRRIDSLSAEGGEVVWGWDTAAGGLTPAPQCGLMPKGSEPVLRVTLEDGRTLRATANHPIWTLGDDGVGRWTRVGDLSADPAAPTRVQVGLTGPLDEPKPDEAGWSLRADTYNFTMETPEAREKTLAFARIVGYLLADGCIAQYSSYYVARAYLGHPLDVNVFLHDVELVAGKCPVVRAPVAINPDLNSKGVWAIDLPKEMRRAIHGLEDIAKGRRATQAWSWPAFVKNAPVTVIREFLAGLFGGDGHAPCVVRSPANNRKAKGDADRLFLKGVALTLTTTEELVPSMLTKMAELAGLLARVGVTGARIDGPVRRTAGIAGRVQCGVAIPPTTLFADKIGFRYCVDKAVRLEAASAYWRMIETVKQQHDYVIEHTTLLYEEIRVSLPEARALACELLAINEHPLNPYYSTPPMSVINRRRSPGRQTALDRLDYTRIADVEAFFREMGILTWFYQEGVTGKQRVYIMERNEVHIPGFSLRVVNIRPDGNDTVYDIGVPGPKSYCSHGIVTSNSVPTRMVIGQMLETSLGLRCQAEGVIADGTPFRTVSVDEIAAGLEEIGLRHSGLTRLYNGNTGEHYDAAIFMGPTFHQRLQKFVEDDKYAVGGYGPTDALTGQPLDGKNARGGLRLGEMEGWVLESHGAMATLAEKVLSDSDGQKQFVCRVCGTPAIYNAHQGIYRCTTCGEAADIGAVDSCKASIVFQHEMRSANVKVTLGTRPREFEEPLPE